MADAWWLDDGRLRSALLAEVGDLKRHRLDAIVAPAVPGAYLVFLAAPRLVPKLGGDLLALGKAPVYAGAARSLRERVARYRISLRGVLDTDEMYFALLPTASPGAALHAENICIETLRPIFNGTAFGSKNPGSRRRGQRISLVDALLSRRTWARQASVVEQAVAQLWLVRRLARLDEYGRRWPPLCAPIPARVPAPVIPIGRHVRSSADSVVSPTSHQPLDPFGR